MSTKDTTPAVEAPEAVDTPAPVAPAADPVIDRLVELGLLPADAEALKHNVGLSAVEDIRLVTQEDLKEVGLTKITQRKFLEAIAPAPVVPDTNAPIVNGAAFDILPAVPADESWLTSLKTGGVTNVNESTVIGAIRAALARQVGLYDVPGKLVAAMETFADESEEQVDPIFYQLREQMTRRNYADVFAAIPGLNGSFVTEKRKNQLLGRLDQLFWPAVIDFDDQLRGWRQVWMQAVTGPDAFMAAIAASGGVGGLPPGIIQMPDTAPLRDAADAVKDAINRVFAGTGVQISGALAFEASEIKKSLEDPRLPALVGVPNRDQLLKKLHVAVPATYARLELNVVKYVLGLLHLEDQTSGNEERDYLSALFALGSQIDWSKLSGSRRDNDFSRIGDTALRDQRRM